MSYVLMRPSAVEMANASPDGLNENTKSLIIYTFKVSKSHDVDAFHDAHDFGAIKYL